MKQRIGIQGSMAITAAILLFFFSRYFVRPAEGSVLDIALNVFGLGLVVSGCFIRMSSRGHKQEYSCGSEALVRDGLYEYTRNPMYLGTFCLGTGSVLAVLQPWTLLIFWAGYFSIYVPQVRREEVWLTEKFAGKYGDYCAQVPRIFPVLSRFPKFFAALFPSRWSWVKREWQSCSILLAVLLVIQLTRGGTVQGASELAGEAGRFLAVLLVMGLALIAKIGGREE